MKKVAIVTVAALVFLLSVPGALFAQRGSSGGDSVVIRIASPLPRNSDWGRVIDRIASEWARVTNNTVRVQVFHDGLEGGESRMLSSLSTNHIQAALFTTYGLAEIVPEVMSLSVPFQIRDDAELDLVLASVLPILEEKSQSTSYVVLAWSKAGWVNLFSRDSILEPNDLRRMRLATTGDSGNMNSVFRGMGFNLVEAELQDIGPMLASGSFSAIYSTPAAIAPLGLHRSLRFMLDMPLAPFLGGIVMNRITWDRLGPQRQRAIMDVTRRMTVDFDRTMPRTVSNAITMMSRDGLSVQTPSPKQQEMWHSEVQTAMPPLLGSTFDRDMFNLINSILERSRSRR